MDIIGYAVAAVLAVGMVLGAGAIILALRRKQKMKGVNLQPWKVHIEFYEGEE